MHNNTKTKLKREIKLGIIAFMLGLILSGITAFPLETELKFLNSYLFDLAIVGDWIQQVYNGIRYTNQHYPFLSYGTDWLAFAHLVIAVSFVGPLRDPVKNIWVLEFGMIACIAIFPLAFIAGPIRGIPLFHQIIDCLFGVFGFALLYWVYRKVKRLEKGI